MVTSVMFVVLTMKTKRELKNSVRRGLWSELNLIDKHSTIDWLVETCEIADSERDMAFDFLSELIDKTVYNLGKEYFRVRGF